LTHYVSLSDTSLSPDSVFAKAASSNFLLLAQLSMFESMSLLDLPIIPMDLIDIVDCDIVFKQF
jgi:hypothetical protein